MREVIPLADFDALAPHARRSRFVRLVFGAAVVVSVLAAAGAGRDASSSDVAALPASAVGIVVLDVSASVSSDTYARIAATLSRLARSDRRYGLVVFSDVAYEALPPGSRAAEVGRFARFFRTRTNRGPLASIVPPNPWSATFSGGTKISSGLALALRVAKRSKIDRPAMLLVSDLDDDPQDLPALSAVTLAYRATHTPLRVVALNPSPEDEQLFESIIGRGAVGHAPATVRRSRDDAGVDWTLVAFATLALVALATSELRRARVSWEPHT